MSDAAERAVSTAHDLEDLEDPEDIEVLEVKILAGLDGRARTVTAVLTVGGPHIEVNLSNGTVTASWGGDSHTTHFEKNDATEALRRRYLRMWTASETSK